MLKSLITRLRNSSIFLVKSLFGSSALVFISNMIISLINALAGLFIARVLTVEAYGRVAYFLSIYLLFVLFSGFGLTTKLITDLSRYKATGESGELNQAFCSLLMTRIFTILLVFVLGGVFAFITKDVIFIIVCATAGISLLLDFFSGALMGLQFIRKIIFVLLSQPIIYIVLLLIIQARNETDIFYSFLASFILSLLLAIFILWNTRVFSLRKEYFSIRYAFSSLKVSVQYYLLVLLQTVYTIYAITALGNGSRFQETGLFSVAFNLVKLIPAGIAGIIPAIYYPRLNGLVARKEYRVAQDLFYIYTGFVSILALFASIIVALFPTSIIHILYTSKYVEAAPLLVILSPMGVFLVLDGLLTMTMVALGIPGKAIIIHSIRMLILIAIVGIALNSTTNPAHVMSLLTLGYLVSASTGMILQIYLLKSKVAFRLPIGFFLKVAMVCMVIGFFLHYLLPKDQVWYWELSKIMLTIGSFCVLTLIMLLRSFPTWRNWVIRSNGMLFILVIVLSCLLAPQHVKAQGSEQCAGSVADSHWLLIDCQPGYATNHDAISIYLRDGSHSDQPWNDQLDQTNAVWIFDPGAAGKAGLIIDFHQEKEALQADIFDDGDKDGSVAYRFISNGIAVTENEGHWTVRVSAPAGWWIKDGKTNFNLDMWIDGPVRGSYGSGFIYDVNKILKTDGKADFILHVRDADNDGKPEYEWRQDYPPLPENPRISGYYRTSIMVNPQDDEVPINGSIFWPYLSGKITSFVKEYNFSGPPIEVDWSAAKIIQVSEFVASRGNPGNYFVYSINRVKESETTATDFENPFAFYDLSGVNDGWPDMTIRFEAFPKGEYLARFDLNNVQYTWDQYHTHNWNYEVALTGRQTISETIHLPEFSIAAVPPDQLPYWVTRESWDAATFVEAEKPYWSSEHIYEWTTNQGNNVLQATYISGYEATPPYDSFSQIKEGLRGEYAFNLAGKPYLYFSPIDHKLHLLNVEAGIWNIERSKEIHYRNLGGAYINQWETYDHGSFTNGLFFTDGYLIYTDKVKVQIAQCHLEPFVFKTLPPRNHEEWQLLGESLKNHKADFAANDLEAMFQQFDGPSFSMQGASIRDFRLTKRGFRFVIDLQPVYMTQGPNLLKIDHLKSGLYAVTYDGQFHIEQLTPANLSLTLRLQDTKNLKPGNQILLQIEAQNTGLEDANNLILMGKAENGRESIEIGPKTLSVLANDTAHLAFDWQPTQSADWHLQFWVEDTSGRQLARTSSDVSVSKSNPFEIFFLSNGIGEAESGYTRIGYSVLAAILSLLAVCALFTALAWRIAWTNRESTSPENPDQ